MKTFFYLFSLILICFGSKNNICLFAQTLVYKTQLPKKIKETSGLEFLNQDFLTHNDSGGKPVLYRLTFQGDLLEQYNIEGAENNDWEDIAQDESFIYISDSGNNKGKRKNLNILIVDPKDNFKKVGQLAFHYNDQQNFDKKNIGLIIIDGVADLCSDVNNIEESNLIVQKIMTWSSVYNCHIVLVVHLNHNSEKSTGHLGSFMTKKCETELLLTQNEGESEIISVKCKRSRNFSFKTFNFTVDDLGYPKVLDDVDDIVPNEPQEKSRWQKQLKY